MANVNKWCAASGRISLFPETPPPVLPSAQDIYRKVWSEDPDVFQRPQNALSPGIARGKNHGLVLQCLIHPSRMDLDFRGLPEKDDPSLPLIADFNLLKNELNSIISTIRTGFVSVPIARIGLFYHFLNIQPDIAAANNTIMKVIPSSYAIKLNEEEDFIFQINRPKAVASEGNTVLNSVINWAIQRIQMMTITATTGQNALAPQTESVILTAASITVDINNVPTTVLDSARQAGLLDFGQTKAEEIQHELGLIVH
jgi:hypothetical protein